MEYRSSGGLDFQHTPLLLDNPNGEYSHLQRSIDTLRSLSERTVDFRLNINQDLRNLDLRTERYNDRSSPMDRNLNNRGVNGVEINLSLSQERINEHRGLNLDTNLRSLQIDRNLLQERPLHLDNSRDLDRGLQHDRLNLERSLSSERLSMPMDERISGRITPERIERISSMDSRDMNHEYKDMSDIKYREYKSQLDCLRGIDGRTDGQDEGRGTPSTPPTPVSVGENNYHEEKVMMIFLL